MWTLLARYFVEGVLFVDMSLFGAPFFVGRLPVLLLFVCKRAPKGMLYLPLVLCTLFQAEHLSRFLG
jgi:hypothetical protein